MGACLQCRCGLICCGLLHLQVARDKLVALGTCIGKFTHSGKFRLTIGALDLLAQFAKYKVRLGQGGQRDAEHAMH